MINTIPKNVYAVLEALYDGGYEAYIVGGAVRDMLIGRKVKDYDITTRARPEEIIALAERKGWRVIDRLGQNFGVVMLVVEGTPMEVTAFRGERYGEDSHRPAKVWYAETLEEDLARRDFTMNAMAISPDGQIIDPFEGRTDLAKGLIRTVGNAEERFAEDALRMFRACRFAAELGFTLEDDLLGAMRGNLYRIRFLSLARVRQELDRLLLGNYCSLGLEAFASGGLMSAVCRVKREGKFLVVPILPEIEHLLGLSQNPRYHIYDVWRHTLAAVNGVSSDLTLRWAALLHDIGKGLPSVRGVNREGQPTDHGHDKAGAELAAQILTRLQVPVKIRQRVVWLVENHMRFHFYAHEPEAVAVTWVRSAARSGKFADNAEMSAAFGQLVAVCRADVLATGLAQAVRDKAVEFGETLLTLVVAMPVHTRDLVYVSSEIGDTIGRGQEFGLFIKTALRRVQDGELANTPEEIGKAAAKWAARRKNDAKKQ